MIKFAPIVFAIALLVSCQSTKIDRVQKIPVFLTPPVELMDCPHPPVVTQDFIDGLSTESDYTERFVLPLYQNNVRCAESADKLRDWAETHANTD